VNGQLKKQEMVNNYGAILIWSQLSVHSFLIFQDSENYYTYASVPL
jgi:hypothetical protein